MEMEATSGTGAPAMGVTRMARMAAKKVMGCIVACSVMKTKVGQGCRYDGKEWLRNTLVLEQVLREEH
jgi:hypothetical protein